MAKQFVDDTFGHIKEDHDRMRKRHRMYISYSNEAAARTLVIEALANAIDECRSSRSPANRISIDYDEGTGFITIADNGRGIPTEYLELVFTTLHSGSNLENEKAELKTNTLGRNGVGTLAVCALSTEMTVTSYRGGTENIQKTIRFRDGVKYDELVSKCDSGKHGLTVTFLPSKQILGKGTRIIWKDIRKELINTQFLEKKIRIDTVYTDHDGKVTTEKFQARPFEEIIRYIGNGDRFLCDTVSLEAEDDNVEEVVTDTVYKRFVSVQVAFAYTESLTPYVDSFANGSNTVDNGHHLDGAMDGVCRYFQRVTKASLNERDKIDIKWDDIRAGLSLVVSLGTNMENIFTGQTKHRVNCDSLKPLVQDMVIDCLNQWGDANGSSLKEIISIIKMNARARRESDRVRSAVVKDQVTNWSSFQMKNYDPCSARGKEYKELFIIEGDWELVS